MFDVVTFLPREGTKRVFSRTVLLGKSGVRVLLRERTGWNSRYLLRVTGLYVSYLVGVSRWLLDVLKLTTLTVTYPL